MKGGCIQLHRTLASHDIWLGEKFSRGQAWADLLMLANYKDGTIYRRGIKVTVKRGQLGHSQETLSQRWGWSKGKVLRFLDDLKERGMISQTPALKNIAVTALIAITNYNQYQWGSTEDEGEDGTINDPRTIPKTVPEQEGEEGKKEKKRSSPLPPRGDADALFDEFWQAYPKKTAKPVARKAWDKLEVDAPLSARMVQAIEKFKRTEQWEKDSGQYIPNPASWLNQRRWEDEIETGGNGGNWRTGQFAGVR